MSARWNPRMLSFCGAMALPWLCSEAPAQEGDPLSKAPPPQAAGAGFTTLALLEEFKRLDLSNSDRNERRWWPRLWWYDPGDPSTYSYTLLPDGGLKITTTGAGASLYNHPDDAQPFSSGYLYGYFEARMRFAGPVITNNCGAFWLFSKSAIENKVTDANGDRRWCEIDIVETGGHNVIGTTVHAWRWPPDNKLEDRFNENHINRTTTDPIDGEWHTFGLLWKEHYLAWYVDDKLIATHGSFPVCNTQPMTIVVSAQSHANDKQETDVKWIKVWQPE